MSKIWEVRHEIREDNNRVKQYIIKMSKGKKSITYFLVYNKVDFKYYCISLNELGHEWANLLNENTAGFNTFGNTDIRDIIKFLVPK